MEVLSLNIGAVIVTTLFSNLGINKILKAIIYLLLSTFYAYTLITNDTLTSNFGNMFCMTLVLVFSGLNILGVNKKPSSTLLLLPALMHFPEIWQKALIMICFYLSKNNKESDLYLAVGIFISSMLKIPTELTLYVTTGQALICSYLVYSKYTSSKSSMLDKVIVIYSLINMLSTIEINYILNIMFGLLLIVIIMSRNVAINYNLVGIILFTYLIELKYLNQIQFLLIIFSMLTMLLIKEQKQVISISSKYIEQLKVVTSSLLLLLIIIITTENYNYLVINIVLTILGGAYFLKKQNEIFSSKNLTVSTFMSLCFIIVSLLGFVLC